MMMLLVRKNGDSLLIRHTDIGRCSTMTNPSVYVSEFEFDGKVVRSECESSVVAERFEKAAMDMMQYGIDLRECMHTNHPDSDVCSGMVVEWMSLRN